MEKYEECLNLALFLFFSPVEFLDAVYEDAMQEDAAWCPSGTMEQSPVAADGCG